MNAIKEAIEALESCTPGDYSTGHVIHPSYDEDKVNAAIAALRSMPAEPYAYAVYFPDQPTEELVHDLDELLDDMTNRKHTVTELFAASPTAPAQAEPVGNALQIADAIDPFTRKQAPDHLTMGVAASLLRALATPPSAATPEPSDAERYRLVRRGQHWSVIDGIGNVLRGDDLDAAIDAIRATKGGKL